MQAVGIPLSGSMRSSAAFVEVFGQRQLDDVTGARRSAFNSSIASSSCCWVISAARSRRMDSTPMRAQSLCLPLT